MIHLEGREPMKDEKSYPSVSLTSDKLNIVSAIYVCVVIGTYIHMGATCSML